MKDSCFTAKNIFGLIAWVLISLCAGLIGSQFRPGEWYQALAKPAWTPPAFVFAPVWTLLYVLMGLAAWLVWRKKGFNGARPALLLFIGQLILNALWSFLFFGLQSLYFSLLEIIVLWAAIFAVIILFWKETKTAGILMLPYLVWVGFAAILNLALWQMNRGL